MNKQNILWTVAGLALVLSIIGLVGGHNQSAPSTSFGGVTNFDSLTLAPTTVAEGLKVGTSSPIAVNNLIAGVGSIVGNAPVTASTTKAFDIAVTGAVKGDLCWAMPASTTQAYIGFQIVGCSASTTSGFITLLVDNPGVTAAVPFPIASSTQYLVVRIGQ